MPINKHLFLINNIVDKHENSIDAGFSFCFMMYFYTFTKD